VEVEGPYSQFAFQLQENPIMGFLESTSAPSKRPNSSLVAASDKRVGMGLALSSEDAASFLSDL